MLDQEQRRRDNIVMLLWEECIGNAVIHEFGTSEETRNSFTTLTFVFYLLGCPTYLSTST